MTYNIFWEGLAMLKLGFDSFGWWDNDSLLNLRSLRADGDNPGWCFYSPDRVPHFISGATSIEEAAKAGMPADAQDGKLTRPSKLLDE